MRELAEKSNREFKETWEKMVNDFSEQESMILRPLSKEEIESS